RILEWSLDHRAITALVALGTFALTFPLNRLVGRDFIPADDQSELTAQLYTPTGTSIEGSARVAREAAHQIEKIRGVLFLWPTIAAGNPSRISFYIRLIDASQRKYSNLDVADDIRHKVMALPQYQGMRNKVLVPSALGSGENFAPIRALIRGPDFFKAAEIAKRGMDEMHKLRGVVD